jgi:hypothetical protein
MTNKKLKRLKQAGSRRIKILIHDLRKQGATDEEIVGQVNMWRFINREGVTPASRDMMQLRTDPHI